MTESKKVLYRQTTKYGCGSFTLANIFHDERFVREIPDAGEGMAQMGRKMARFTDYDDLYMNVIFFTNSNLAQGNRFTTDQAELLDYPEGMGDLLRYMCRPFVFWFCRPDGTMHSVGVIQYDGNYYWVDSCCEFVEVGTLEHFIEKYHIFAVFCFSMWDAEDAANFSAAPAENFAHII